MLVATCSWLGAHWLVFNLAEPAGDHAAALFALLWAVPLQAAVFSRFAAASSFRRAVVASGLVTLMILFVLSVFLRADLVPLSMLIVDSLLLVILMVGGRWARRRWTAKNRAELALPTGGAELENVRFASFVAQHMDRQAYLQAYPDVQKAGMDPVTHWLEHGMVEGRSFFPDAAVRQGDDAELAEGPQWQRFSWRGRRVAVWIYDPVENARFASFVAQHIDRQAYLEAYPDVQKAGMDPVKHWLEHGLAEGRLLSPGLTVVCGDVAKRFDEKYWRLFTWRNHFVAIRRNKPIKASISKQIEAQARHDPAVLAVGRLAVERLRQIDGPDLLGRSGLDVTTIFAAIPEQPDVVILMRSLSGRSVTQYTADLVQGLGLLHCNKILVVVTEDTAKTAGQWESRPALAPLRAANVVFWRDICGQDHHHVIPLYLGRLLNALRPSHIVVVDSRVGIEIIAQFGRGLSRFAKLYCACLSTAFSGYGSVPAVRFLPKILPFSMVLTDSSALAATIRQRWAELVGPGVAVLPPQSRSIPVAIFDQCIEASRARASRMPRLFRWIVLSTLAPSERAATMTALAKMRPSDHFEILDGDGTDVKSDAQNITHRCFPDGGTSVDAAPWDGFMFIGASEGVSQIVLEMIQRAIPIIVSNVGGFRDTFDEAAVDFVVHGQDADETAAAFSSALDQCAGRSFSEVHERLRAAKAQMLLRHDPAVYRKILAEIFTVSAHV